MTDLATGAVAKQVWIRSHDKKCMQTIRMHSMLTTTTTTTTDHHDDDDDDEDDEDG